MASEEKMDQTANTGTESIRPSFPPVTLSATLVGRSKHPEEPKERKIEVRRVPVPPHRYTPLRDQWMKIFTPVVDHLKLQIRFNLKTKTVEIRTCADTTNANALQKAADFVKAFTLGFEVDDAVALIRLDDLYLESFDIKDVKTLKGDHLSRAIGRLAGKSGKTRYMIENITKTRIVLAGSKVHIMGSYQNILSARRAISKLILGSPPAKVYGKLRTVHAAVI